MIVAASKKYPPKKGETDADFFSFLLDDEEDLSMNFGFGELGGGTGLDPDKIKSGVRMLFGMTADEQVHAPSGGVTLKGKKFTGGQFIPVEGGYQEAYKKQKEGNKKAKAGAEPAGKQVKAKAKQVKAKPAAKGKLNLAKAKLSKKGKEPSEKALLVGTIRGEDKKLTMADGSPLPEHIAHLKIPPAWQEVVINPDPKGDVLVRGRDKKGRLQSVYSAEHDAKVSAIKWAKVNELNEKFDDIKAENDSNLNGDNHEKAVLMRLIMGTGIRPGSEKDTKAEKQAYGATTLLGKHVMLGDGKVTLTFVGKKGKENNFTIVDKLLVKELSSRAKKAGADGRLFSSDVDNLRKYSRTLDGGKFNPKDMRTLVGTAEAMKEVRSSTVKPANEKQYKKMVKAVAIKVAEKLNNTPAICLKSYISPVVWSEWRIN